MTQNPASRPWWLLASPGFLAGLALLVVNDAVLKAQHPGIVTGKLSDVAGLWVFPMLWCVLAPRRAGAIYVATAVAFALWKSPMAQPLIDGWNGVSPLTLGRVTDATDLVALSVLPASAIYARHAAANRPARISRVLGAPIMLVALFAFAATSSVPLEYGVVFGESDPANVFRFHVPKDDLIRALDAGHIDQLGRRYEPPDPPFFSSTMEVQLKADFCDSRGYVSARAEFRDTGDNESAIVLTQALSPCRDRESHRDELRGAFEAEVIEPLHAAVHDR